MLEQQAVTAWVHFYAGLFQWTVPHYKCIKKMDFLNGIFFSLVYFKTIVYNIYNMQNAY